MLLGINRESIEHPQLAEMENTVYAIRLVLSLREAHRVTGDIEDDQPLQVLQLNRLLDVCDHVVSQVEFHQTLELFETVKPHDVVVF